MDITFPTSIYGWLAIMATITSGVLVIRRTDISALRSANDDLRRLLDDKQKLIDDLQSQLNALKIEVGKFRALLEEKDKRIDTLAKISIATSPELTAYMQDMKAFSSQVHEYMINSSRQFTEIATLIKKH